MRLKTTIIAGLLSLSSLSLQAAKLECPSLDFKTFLNAYMADVTVQKAFTQIPGTPIEKLTFPMIPNADSLKKEGMKLSIKRPKRNHAEVYLEKDQTDYRIIFYFNKKACWQLIRAEDVSG